VRFTDTESYFVSEASVYRLLNSALLKSRFGQLGSAVTAMTRMANPSGDAATRIIATASSV
jgi:hypothetical protein